MSSKFEYDVLGNFKRKLGAEYKSNVAKMYDLCLKIGFLDVFIKCSYSLCKTLKNTMFIIVATVSNNSQRAVKMILNRSEKTEGIDNFFFGLRYCQVQDYMVCMQGTSTRAYFKLFASN